MKRTPLTPIRLRFLVTASLALTLLLAGTFAGAAEFESAEKCKGCHKAIYEQWKGSLHASALTHPDFLLPYNRLRREDPAKATLCEKCHDPLRGQIPKGSLKAAAFSTEGVTCDFCHSVVAVGTSGPYPRKYTLRAGVKVGPLGKKGPGNKSIHVTRPSSLLITSNFCAGCHEFRNEFDVPVLTTVSEWESSFYKGEGVHCQYCHLPELFDARFVEGDKSQRKGPADHAMVGGHSRERLSRAIPIRASLTTTPAGAEVTVKLRNETVGHMTPSGMPSHRIRLVSTIYDEEGKGLGTKEEHFERVLGNGKGKRLSSPDEFFSAREVISDNRMAPKEERTVRHRFPLAAGQQPVAAEVSLIYELPTHEIGPGLHTVEIPISKSTVTIRQGKHWKAIAIAAGGSLAAVLLGVFYAMFRRKGRQ